MTDDDKSAQAQTTPQDEFANAKRKRQDMQKRIIPSMWTAPQSLIHPPNPAHLPSPNRAAAYFRRVALPHDLNGPMPTKGQRIANLAGGIFGAITCVYLVLFHDFGERDHVFSPVRRFFSIDTFNPMVLTNEEKEWAHRKRLGSKRDEERIV